MSWEVRTMKSKISLFNWGVSKNLLRRCWPLWVGYFVLVMILLPGEMMNRLGNIDITVRNANRYVLSAGIDVAVIAVFVAAAAAMVMYSYLYSAKGSGMMCSLPLRRETMFFTAYLTGIVPILVADVIAVVSTWLVCLGSGAVRNLVFAQTLGLILTANIAFYNFAVLCAMLTGSIIIMPFVYFVLSNAVYVAENMIRTVLAYMVYGMSYSGSDLMFLSPMTMVINRLMLDSENTWDYEIIGMNYLLIFMAVSFLMVGLAIFILRRRHMESATDVVAVPILKPVFKYCMAVGCAFVFCYMIFESFFRDKLVGFPEALVIITLLAAGAFIGYFVSEMLMQKTVRVFGNRKKFRGWGICCAAMAVFILCFEFDAFGYERRIPELDKIERIHTNDATLAEPENVEKMLALHQQIIDNKDFNENSDQTHSVFLQYYLEDGRVFMRQYWLAWDWDTINDESSDVCTLQKLVNLQEAIDNRCQMDIPLSSDTVTGFTVHSYTVNEFDEFNELNVKLSPEQAEDFYNSCLLPDIKDGKMGRRWIAENQEYYNTMTNVRFEIELSNRSLLPAPVDNTKVEHEYFTFNLGIDAERCMKWVEENTQVEPLLLVEADRGYKDYAEISGDIFYEDAAVREFTNATVISN